MRLVPAMESMMYHQEQPVNLAIGGCRPLADNPSAVKLELIKADLWRDFHRQGTEMIITKSGRNLYPKLQVRLSGLQPNEHYTVVMEMRLAAPRRFKYSNNRWVDAGEAEPQFDEHRTYVQTVAPAKNATTCDVDLKNAKISNNIVEGRGNIVLTSMHKYIPYFHVIRGANMRSPFDPSSVTTAFFPETEFIAVTAYQNDAITQMKIQNNPFAKGFRETGRAQCRRNQRQRASPTTMLRGARDALEAMQEAGRDDSASPMSSASSTSSASSSHGEQYVCPGMLTPPPSRTPTPPPKLPSTFGIADILYGDRYSSRRVSRPHAPPTAPATPASPAAPAPLPVHPLYQFMYAHSAHAPMPVPMPAWQYPGFFAPAVPTLAAEAYHPYSSAQWPRLDRNAL